MQRISFLIFVMLFGAGLTTSQEEYKTVNTNQGTLEGIQEETINGREFYSFYGIPYAKPPIGKLRFKDPEASNGWNGVLQAKTMPEYCKQISLFAEFLGTSRFVGEEDCLYLNVHIPKIKDSYTEGKLPVMVFIHGGGFICGGAKEYSPKTLMDEDIILVFIQYRLGVFGFMSTEDSVIPGNFGLKDQTLALKWVNENIEDFGGDIERITIFGESAGGASVHYQILTPWAKGLFSRAIMQSGTAILPWARDNQHKEVAEKMGKTVNCTLEKGSEDFLNCMQSADGLELLKFIQGTFIFILTPNYMTPRVDGDFLPEDAEVLVRDRKYNKVDIMAGICRDEGAGFLDFMTANDTNTLKENLPAKLFFEREENPEELTSKVKSRYFKEKEVSIENTEELIRALGDRYNIIGHQVTLRFHINDPGTTVYLYELHQNPVVSALKRLFGMVEKTPWISHGTDLEYLFLGGGLFQVMEEKNEVDQLMRKYFVKLWTNFAKTGNPTPDDSLGIIWKKSDSKMNFLAIKSKLEMMENFRQEDVDWWLTLPLTEFKLLGIERDTQNTGKMEL